mmetsp:Transcript_103408/g.188564  ORF Transcript_103408/g.188564 Transcript_103408/m.188564 type:complete len:379 (-) Transcript_103408:100-1236(-)
MASNQEPHLAESETSVKLSTSVSVGRPISICNWVCFVLLCCFSFICGILVFLASFITCGLLVKRIPGLTVREEIVQRTMQVLMSGFFARFDYGIAGPPVTALCIKLEKWSEDRFVVGRDVETALGHHACCYQLHGDDTTLSNIQVVMIWNHGGGYAMGSAYAEAGFSRKVLEQLKEAGLTSVILSPHYPLLHVATAQSGKAIDAVAAAHAWTTRKCSSARIVLGGDSAGGHLAIVSLLNKQFKVDGLVLLSPLCNANAATWAEEAKSRNSTDYINTKLVHIWKDAWCGGEYSHPHVFIDLDNLSALPDFIFVEAGGAEIFRSQIELFITAAIIQGKQVRFEITEHMPHEYMLTPHLKNHLKSKEAIQRLGGFLASLVA